MYCWSLAWRIPIVQLFSCNSSPLPQFSHSGVPAVSSNRLSIPHLWVCFSLTLLFLSQDPSIIGYFFIFSLFLFKYNCINESSYRRLSDNASYGPPSGTLYLISSALYTCIVTIQLPWQLYLLINVLCPSSHYNANSIRGGLLSFLFNALFPKLMKTLILNDISSCKSFLNSPLSSLFLVLCVALSSKALLGSAHCLKNNIMISGKYLLHYSLRFKRTGIDLFCLWVQGHLHVMGIQYTLIEKMDD